MSFALIDAKRAEVPIETACAALNVSVSGFYAWRTRPASQRQTDDMIILAHIRAEFETSNETYGSPRMHAELKERGLATGRHRVARLMSENDRRLVDQRQDEKRLGNGCPAARHHSATTAAGTHASLRPWQPILLRRLSPPRARSWLHRVVVPEARVFDRMSGRGNCYDNAMVETVFKTIKSELIWRTSFATRDQARKAIGQYIEGFYNPRRRHSGLSYVSPAAYEAAHRTGSRQERMALH